MKYSPLEKKLADLITPVVESQGCELVCIRTVGEGGSMTVQIFAENPETSNLGLDDCAKISREISAILDVEDPISGTYRLEVSSPGIDRPLVREKDYERYAGYDVKIELETPLDGQKRFRGILKGYNQDSGLISLESDEGLHELPYASIHKARLVLTDALLNLHQSQSVN